MKKTTGEDLSMEYILLRKLDLDIRCDEKNNTWSIRVLVLPKDIKDHLDG